MRAMKGFILFLCLVGFSALSGAADASVSTDQGQDPIYAVVQYDVTKARARITVGKYTHDELMTEDIRYVMSVEVPPGYVIEAFSGKSFNLNSKKIYRSGKVGFPAQSIIFRKAGDINFGKDRPVTQSRAASSEVVGRVQYDITRANAGILPGRYSHTQLMTKDIRYVQSVTIPSGYLMIAYAGDNFTGKSVKLYRSGKVGFGARSIEFRKVGDVKAFTPEVERSSRVIATSSMSDDKGEYVIIFARADHRGNWAKLKPGKYGWDFLKDRAQVSFVRSIYVPPGHEVICYTRDKGSGDSEVFHGSGNLHRSAMSIEIRKL